MSVCPLCGSSSTPSQLAEAAWLAPDTLNKLALSNPHWRRSDGACPACVQQALLEVLLNDGEVALHERIQQIWPLDAEAAFGALPTPLRMHADPRHTGRGITIALVDSGFYPHPDLVQPRNRIRAWVDAGSAALVQRCFGTDELPTWPSWDAAAPQQWDGLMTSTVAAGNGYLSHGFYRGMASDADLILIQVRDDAGRISNASITRALTWLHTHGPELGVRVVSISVSGDPVEPLAGNSVDEAVAALVAASMIVVVAAGNDGQRHLVPPATAPLALTIGGLDDMNTFDHTARALWHSNYGATAGGLSKPELVAPSIWLVAPLLPDTPTAAEAAELFARRAGGDPNVEMSIAAQKLVTPHYQHVDGTSFAAPLIAGIAACMLEANPALTPRRVRELLIAAAEPVPGASPERQGAGAIHAFAAVALALADQHSPRADYAQSPLITSEGIIFLLHDHQARAVRVLGSWNGWAGPGVVATAVEPGVWQTDPLTLASGNHLYKFLIDDGIWNPDPANPLRATDGFGGWNSVLHL
jgi:serine protease AprX